MLLCIFCFSDAVAVTLINCLTSFFAGFVIFSVLGFMSHTRQVPIDRVAAKGLNMKVNAKCFVHCLLMWSFMYKLTCTIVHVHILLIFCLMIVSLIYCTERVFIEFIWSKMCCARRTSYRHNVSPLNSLYKVHVFTSL